MLITLSGTEGDEPKEHIMESLLTARDVARLAAVPRTLVYRSARDGSLASIRIGRTRRFRAADVETWLARSERRYARRLRHFRATDRDAWVARDRRARRGADDR
jgi:excisionase family DNA binding protein